MNAFQEEKWRSEEKRRECKQTWVDLLWFLILRRFVYSNFCGLMVLDSLECKNKFNKYSAS